MPRINPYAPRDQFVFGYNRIVIGNPRNRVIHKGGIDRVFNKDRVHKVPGSCNRADTPVQERIPDRGVQAERDENPVSPDRGFQAGDFGGRTRTGGGEGFILKLPDHKGYGIAIGHIDFIPLAPFITGSNKIMPLSQIFHFVNIGLNSVRDFNGPDQIIRMGVVKGSLGRVNIYRTPYIQGIHPTQADQVVFDLPPQLGNERGENRTAF
jgi:hypothetical protein